MATLTNVSSLGVVKSESFSKDSNLFKQPLPRSNSTASIVLDLFGAGATITISGAYTTSHGTISTMVTELKALIDGQQTRRTYTSDVSGTYNIYVTSVKFDVQEGAGTTTINYEIEMMEGA